jgi:hypothetical protein
MALNSVLKSSIMITTKTALELSSTKKITFKDSGDNVLAELLYDNFSPVVSTNPSGNYQFYSAGPTPTQLKGKVIKAGTVNSFEISGVITDPIPKLIYGSVGNMSSNALIKFTKTLWVLNNTIKINKLILSIGD